MSIDSKNMKYYFTGSTKNLNEDSPLYKIIFEQLDLLGYMALNYVHLIKNDPTRVKYENILVNNELSVYQLQTSLIDQSDVLIAEISRESITVGYQIDYALRKKIPVLVLVNKNCTNTLPVMLTSNHYGLLTVEKYSSSEDVRQILKNFTNSVVPDKIKFNFFINIQIHNYISKRANKENKTKSEIIREIITKEIKQNPV